MNLSEMRIPRPLGAIIAAWFLTAFIGFFVWLGVYNLWHGAAIIASILWLLLVGTIFGLGCKYEGSRKLLIELLGIYSRRHFVQSLPRENGPAEIRFGYRLLGYPFFYLRVPVDKIESVDWSTGQASHQAGRDVHDWSIGLWYQHGDPEKTKREQQWSRRPEQEVYIVGPPDRKEITTALAQSFLEFLGAAGARLVQGENEHTFVRQRS